MLNVLSVQDILLDITDEEGCVSIIESMLEGKNSDIDIAEETGIKLTTVRKVLYKLNETGITTYQKKLEPKTKSLIYYWKYNQEVVFNILTNESKELKEELEESIKYEESNMFFACKANGHRYKFENASEYNFICPECGDSLLHQDNSARIVELLQKKEAAELMVNQNGKNHLFKVDTKSEK
jgi:transcription initiation factor TFIIE subunit alpha